MTSCASERWTIRLASLFRCLVLIAFALAGVEAGATGYGWYATSFDWQAFIAEQKQGGRTLPDEDLSLWLYSENALPALGVEHMVPTRVELLGHDALTQAWRQSQQVRSSPSWLRYFNTGRHWPSGRERCPTQPFCSDLQFWLSPDEVRDFYYEVRDLLRRTGQLDAGPESSYERVLHDIAKSALLRGRALYFIGHD